MALLLRFIAEHYTIAGVARGESRFLLQAKFPLSKGGLEGLSIWSRTLPRNAQKRIAVCYTSCARAENESLSICSPLYILSNYLCPVLYSQFEGHLGSFKVSFSSPTFAIQTSELQLLTTNLRIIFELTKSKRDGLYLLPPLYCLLNISTRLRFAISFVGN